MDELKDNQQRVIKLITDKIVFPNMTPAKEKDMLNKLYDSVEETFKTIIDGI